MIIIIGLIIGILLISMSIYLFFYLKGVLLLFDALTRRKRNILIILSVLIVLLAFYILDFFLLFLLHFIVLSLIIDFLYSVYFKKYQRFEKIYRLGIIPLLCSSLLIGYGYYHIQQLHRTYYAIETDKQLSKSYRIAYLSDLHYPNALDVERLQSYCDQIEDEQPDMIVLGGDIVDEKTTLEDMQTAFRILGAMKSSLGIYYVYGNHDQAIYTSTPKFTSHQLYQTIEDENIHILSDSSITIHNELIVVGRIDRSLNHKRLTSEQLMDGLDQDDFILLLDHQPIDLNISNELGYDLLLSGHTHNGQIFPLGCFMTMFNEMSYGYKDLGHMQVITSSGMVGWGFPIRTQGNSEYVIIDIETKK